MPLFRGHTAQIVVLALKVASEGNGFGKSDVSSPVSLPQDTAYAHELAEVFLFL
jgi:hypothetical protein